jgi:uncharacterized protein YndB with AHSA1/START domain
MDGTIKEISGGRAIEFQRLLRHSRDQVWQAITEPRFIKKWLTAEAMIEPFEGGNLELKWDNGDIVTGSIVTYEPLAAITFTWIEEISGKSIVSFKLKETEQGTLLTLEHAFFKTDGLPSFLSGWHVHMDVLGLVLNGESFEFPWARQKALQSAYKEMILDGRR